MTPSIENLVSNSWIKNFVTPAKTPTKPQKYVKNKTKWIEKQAQWKPCYGSWTKVFTTHALQNKKLHK